MTFLDLVAGDAVFIDANTFVYHFAPEPSPNLAAGCASAQEGVTFRRETVDGRGAPKSELFQRQWHI